MQGVVFVDLRFLALVKEAVLCKTNPIAAAQHVVDQAAVLGGEVPRSRNAISKPATKPPIWAI